MSDQPDGRALLEVARRTLLDKVLPALPPDKTYDVLMIASAMAIAARELASGAARRDAGKEAVAAFWRASGCAGHAPGDEAGLAAAIRGRRIPESAQAALHGLLLALARSRLMLANPKYPHD
jgi:hypothetical protein